MSGCNFSSPNCPIQPTIARYWEEIHRGKSNLRLLLVHHNIDHLIGYINRRILMLPIPYVIDNQIRRMADVLNTAECN